MRLLTSAIVSASMFAAAPSIAMAQTTAPAAKLSIASARVGAPAGESRLVDGGSGGVIALALLAGIVAIGVLAAVNSDDSPNSP